MLEGSLFLVLQMYLMRIDYGQSWSELYSLFHSHCESYSCRHHLTPKRMTKLCEKGVNTDKWK